MRVADAATDTVVKREFSDGGGTGGGGRTQVTSALGVHDLRTYRASLP